jgi:hypothetical protein
MYVAKVRNAGVEVSVSMDTRVPSEESAQNNTPVVGLTLKL